MSLHLNNHPAYRYKQEIMLADAAILDLRKFVKLAWPIIEPGTAYVDAWHIDAICEHLQAVSYGTIKELLINVPPRHSKSSCISVIWPVWEWIQQPWTRWLFSSYAQSLSTRDALKSRRLIQSAWFQKHYGDKFKLTKDQNMKMRYDNDKGGFRIATSVNGSNTGEGGDRIVCLPYDARIAMKYNSMEIGRIVEHRIHAHVYSWNTFKKKTELKMIQDFFTTETNEIISITTESGRKIELTPNHQLYTGRGYVKAEDILVIDSLLEQDKGFVRVAKIIREARSIKTYNIQVEDNNNYFANGILVHNCDDGNNAAEGESKAVLETTSIWWKEVMSTRKNDPERSARVMVGQRVSALDLSQVFLESANPVHLCLPAEYEGSKSVTVLGWSDPRTEIGELLWPHRFTRPVLEKLKTELGTYGTASQLQQRPTPREGGIIKNQWIKYYKLTRDVYSRITNKFDFIVQSLDTAFKDGEQNDFSVCLTIGVTQTGFYVINRWKGRVDFPELEKMTIEQANIYNPNQLLIEDKASGQSLIQSLRKRTRLSIKAIKVDKDKISRCYAISPIIESGRFFVPEGESWVQDYIDNLTLFPSAKHDDDVDATTQALTELGITKSSLNQNLRHINLMGR